MWLFNFRYCREISSWTSTMRWNWFLSCRQQWYCCWKCFACTMANQLPFKHFPVNMPRLLSPSNRIQFLLTISFFSFTRRCYASVEAFAFDWPLVRQWRWHFPSVRNTATNIHHSILVVSEPVDFATHFNGVQRFATWHHRSDSLAMHARDGGVCSGVLCDGVDMWNDRSTTNTGSIVSIASPTNHRMENNFILRFDFRDASIHRLSVLQLSDCRYKHRSKHPTTILEQFLRGRGSQAGITLLIKGAYRDFGDLHWQFTLLPLTTIIGQLL